jgi:integrase
MRLTKATVARLSIPEGRGELLVFDEALPGFGLRLRAGGKRTWVAQYRLGTKQRRLTLGTTETIDADEARRRAKNALSKVHLGIDHQTEKVEARAQASVTLGAVVEDYLTRRAEKRLKPRSLEEVRRHLQKLWAPLHRLPIQKIRRADIATRLADIARENGPFAANRARASLSGLFNWVLGEGLIDVSPIVGTNKATEEISRDRVLSPEELRLVWEHAGDGDYGDIVRLLILTGQRREEVGGMLWPELDLVNANWRIGAERTKNGLVHDVPLSPAAVEVLKGRSRRDDKREFVFGSRAGPFQGWSNAKEALDGRLREALQDRALREVKQWRLHDIRRTVATRLGDLGVLPHVIEAVLNHVSGHRAGVAGIYNRAAYAAEKRDALERWAADIRRTGVATGSTPCAEALGRGG